MQASYVQLAEDRSKVFVILTDEIAGNEVFRFPLNYKFVNLLTGISPSKVVNIVIKTAENQPEITLKCDFEGLLPAPAPQPTMLVKPVGAVTNQHNQQLSTYFSIRKSTADAQPWLTERGWETNPDLSKYPIKSIAPTPCDHCAKPLPVGYLQPVSPKDCTIAGCLLVAPPPPPPPVPINCINCGRRDLSAATNFCPDCGCPPEKPSEKYCQICDATYPIGSKFCPKHGKPLIIR